MTHWVETVKAWCKSMNDDDIRFFLSMMLGVLLWWFFVGRKRYSTKGMTRNG